MLYSDDTLGSNVIGFFISDGYSLLKEKHANYFTGNDLESLRVLFTEAFDVFKKSVQKYLYFVTDKSIIEIYKEYDVNIFQGYSINILNDINGLFNKQVSKEDLDLEVHKVSGFYSKEYMAKLPLGFSDSYSRVFKIYGDISLDGDINSIRDLDVVLSPEHSSLVGSMSPGDLTLLNSVRDFKYLCVEYISMYAASYLSTYFKFEKVCRKPYSFYLPDNLPMNTKVAMLDMMDYLSQANISYCLLNGLEETDLLPLGTYYHLIFSKHTNFVDLVKVMKYSGLGELVSISKQVQECLGISDSVMLGSTLEVASKRSILFKEFKSFSLARVLPISYDNIINRVHGDPIVLNSFYDFKELRMFKLASISSLGLDCISDSIRVPVLFSLDYSRLFKLQSCISGIHIYDISLEDNQYLCDKTIGDTSANVFHNAVFYNKVAYIDLSKSVDTTMLIYMLPRTWIACGYGIVGLKSLINFIVTFENSEDTIMRNVVISLKSSLISEIPFLKGLLGG